MNELLHALSQMILDNTGWALFCTFIILATLAESLPKLRGGKKAKGELEASKAEIARQHALLQSTQRDLRQLTSGSTPSKPTSFDS